MIRARTSVIRLAALSGLLLLAGLACGGSNDSAQPSRSPGQSSEDIRDRIPDGALSWHTNWTKRSVELSELRSGIPGHADSRDVIRPLDNPAFETVASASDWLSDREPVVLLEFGGEARAYPLQVLIWHEIVNDEIAGAPVAVTYCPLCNSAVTFERTVDGKVLRFGVSGLLRNSDLVMWDDLTESLWQQITGEAIVGDLTGTRLALLPSPVVRWAEFKAAFPDGQVLSRDTGISRSYGVNPYFAYDSQPAPFLFDGVLDARYPAMERVVGITLGGESKAYPFSVIEQEKAVNDELGGEAIVVFWGAANAASALDTSKIPEGRAVGVGIAYLRAVEGRQLTFEPSEEDTFRDRETGTTWDLLGKAVTGPLAGKSLTPVVQTNHLWFAWAAFYPDAPVYGEG